MEQVGDALAAPRVASVADERPPCWWIEKRVRTKKSRSVRSGVRNRTYQSVIPHYDSAPDHTRPEAVDRVGNHTPEQNIKHRLVMHITVQWRKSLWTPHSVRRI